jgi:mannose-6-phosphate isomerase
VLCEIQQHSDLTYRVYDYNRRDAKGLRRPLHIEKAVEVIRFGEQAGGKIDPVRIDRGAVTETYFATCRYFATEKWDFAERIAAETSHEHFDLLIFLAGRGRILWGEERVDFAPAQLWMLPAALGEYHIAPTEPTSVLRTYVPSDLDEFSRRLADRGVEPATWSRLVHL